MVYARCFALGSHNEEVVGLGEHPAIDDNKDWWTGTEPEERAPAVRGGGYEGAVKDGCKEIAYRVALLVQTGKETTGFVGQIVERSSGSRTV